MFSVLLKDVKCRYLTLILRKITDGVTSVLVHSFDGKEKVKCCQPEPAFLKNDYFVIVYP